MPAHRDLSSHDWVAGNAYRPGPTRSERRRAQRGAASTAADQRGSPSVVRRAGSRGAGRQRLGLGQLPFVRLQDRTYRRHSGFPDLRPVSPHPQGRQGPEHPDRRERQPGRCDARRACRPGNNRGSRSLEHRHHDGDARPLRWWQGQRDLLSAGFLRRDTGPRNGQAQLGLLATACRTRREIRLVGIGC